MAKGRSVTKKGTHYNAAATQRAIKSAVAAFRAFSDNVETYVDQKIMEASLIVERDAKDKAPVDTGRLRASITHRFKKVQNGNSYGEVGTNVEYAPWLEYGTSKMSPHPFLTPALEENKATIHNMIIRAINKAEKEAAQNAPTEEIPV